MRTAAPYFFAHSIMEAKFSMPLLALADVAGIDTVLGERGGAFGMICEQLVAVVVEVAHERDVAGRQASERLANAGDCREAASGVLTVSRTSSLPARASASTWATLDSTSAVEVFVIDCTTIGFMPPIVTTRPPQATLTAWVLRRNSRVFSDTA